MPSLIARSGGWFYRNERVQKYVPQVLIKYLQKHDDLVRAILNFFSKTILSHYYFGKMYATMWNTGIPHSLWTPRHMMLERGVQSN
ncbi:MAG: hypothetical protein NVSMB27_41470 [Ktedonobacteraceae bacterium]